MPAQPGLTGRMATATATVYGLLGVLVLWLAPAIVVYRIAERRGRPGWVYLVASLVIGWPVPLLATLVLPRKGPPPA